MAVLNMDTLTDRLTAQFDTTQATIVSVVNERLKDMIVRGRWASAEETLTTTVAGTSVYAIASDMAQIRSVTVGTGDDASYYEWAGEDEIDRASGSGYWFSVSYSSTGVRQLQLYPSPDTTGLAITVKTDSIPAELSYGSTSALPIPDDLIEYLRAGCQAELYQEVDERPDLAAERESKFERGIIKLRTRRQSQVRAGVTRARIEGRDYPAY